MSLFGQTVASITRGLTQMVKNLEVHADAMAAKASKHRQRAYQEQERANEAIAELDKANAVAKKIGELLK